jgi:hypothetical protein
MGRAHFPALAALVFAAATSAVACANPEHAGPGARLSAALGGTLDSDVGEAGGLAHDLDRSKIEIRPGRSIEYRRRVALDIQIALQQRTR